MENRKAYSLREVLIVYNLALVALSAWMVYEVSAVVLLFEFRPSCVLTEKLFRLVTQSSLLCGEGKLRDNPFERLRKRLR